MCYFFFLFCHNNSSSITFIFKDSRILHGGCKMYNSVLFNNTTVT